MDIEVKLQPDLAQPKIVIHAKEMSPEISDVMACLSSVNKQTLLAYQGSEIVPTKWQNIVRVFAESNKVFIKTGEGTFLVKERLYELEELFAGSSLVRVSNSEIVNFDYVRSLDLSLRGTIRLLLTNQEKVFVSRRYVSKIKEYLNLQ